jgi:hypothetical protein
MIRAGLVAVFSVFICMISCRSDPKDPTASDKPKVIAPSYKPPTDTSITHFWFQTDDDDPPGRREWVKNADRWEERYEDGHVTRFKIMKMVPEGSYERPHLVRIADDRFDDQLEVLLPIPVEGAWFEFRRPGETEWHRYKQIHLYPATTRPARR